MSASEGVQSTLAVLLLSLILDLLTACEFRVWRLEMQIPLTVLVSLIIMIHKVVHKSPLIYKLNKGSAEGMNWKLL